MSCFWFHKFEKWEEIARGNLIDSERKTVIGFWIRQERKCLKCGYVEVDIQKN